MYFFGMVLIAPVWIYFSNEAIYWKLDKHFTAGYISKFVCVVQFVFNVLLYSILIFHD